MRPGLEPASPGVNRQNGSPLRLLPLWHSHQSIDEQFVLCVVFDHKQHHSITVVLNLLRKSQANGCFVRVRLIGNTLDHSISNPEINTKNVVLEQVNVIFVNVGNLGKLLLVVIFLVHVKLESEWASEGNTI